MKGDVRPKPKIRSRPTPFRAVSSKDAVNKTAASTPPTHGVQPAANANPTIYELKIDIFDVSPACKLNCLFKNAMRTIPKKMKPND